MGLRQIAAMSRICPSFATASRPGGPNRHSFVTASSLGTGATSDCIGASKIIFVHDVRSWIREVSTILQLNKSVDYQN